MPFDPALSLARHPFFRDHALIFESEPLRRGYAQLRYPMMLGLGGAFSARPPGSGKTTLRHYCAKCFRLQYPDLTVIEVAAHRLVSTATRSFPFRLCLAAGDPNPPRSGQELRQRLETVFVNLAKASEYKRVVLMIDEGQDIGANGFFLLKDLFNHLSTHGLGLSVFITGVAGLLHDSLTKLASKDESGLTRRFASYEIQRTGYESVEDVASVCTSIDTQRFEELDGRTVVESIWPIAAANGLKLTDYANWIYAGFGGKTELLASEIFNVLRWLLVSFEDAAKIGIGDKEVIAAIDATRGGALRFRSDGPEEEEE